MEQYLSIPVLKGSKVSGTETTSHFVVFGKLDGSNIRVEWSKKQGFSKFGTRKRLLSETDPVFGKACSLVNKQASVFESIFKDLKVDNATLFFEFLGDKSFAGFHDPEDNHRVVLIDCKIYKKGYMEPDAFISAFGAKVQIAPVLYTGPLTFELVEEIKQSKLEGMPEEGVVCKLKRYPKSGPVMVKIKSDLWLAKVREKIKDPKLLEEVI